MSLVCQPIEAQTGAAYAPTLKQLTEGIAVADRTDSIFVQSANSPTRSIPVPECHAILDLDQKLQAVHDAFSGIDADELGLNTRDLAERLRTDLRYIGRDEFSAATDAFAERWLERVHRGSGDMLFVGMQRKSSSALIFAATIDKVFAKDPEACKQISAFAIPNQPASDRAARYLASRGEIIIADDWALSGRQMNAAVSSLTNSGTIDREDIEIDLICATNAQLRTGAASEVATYRAFGLPDPVGAPDRIDAVGVTGAHAAPDFGFRLPLNELYSYLPPSHTDLAYPLLYKLARQYPARIHSGDTATTQQETTQACATYLRLGYRMIASALQVA